ncbi:MAG: hypothetical protein IKY66_08215 [Bacteroidales bacterium]|nr:hypothetical protein [Bacteroidales bacterium]
MKRLFCTLIVLLVSLSVFAQNQEEEQKDSLIWLMSAKSAKLVDAEGGRYRKVVGPARFLHNGTFLLCDTALWNLETKIIDAWGNVSILQEETVLTSDNLKYLIDEDLAQFRGSVVQLTDKDHNTLRTRYLDYNTKDSVAVFNNGGAMRDKDGQIIESRKGTYESKIKTFTFDTDVNMFTDSIFVKTTSLVYQSDLNLATFGAGTNAWQDDNMLSSEKGWYDRDKELFLFHDKVHVMTPDQEGWCDSLYFSRTTQDVDMLGHAQMSDTTRNVFSLAGRIQYQDSLAKVTFTRKPAVITQTEEQDGSIDTVYLGAEKLVYYTVRRCDIDSTVVEASRKRLSDLDVDPVGSFRKSAAESAAKAAEEAAMNDPNYRAKMAAEGLKKDDRSSLKAPAAPQLQMGDVAMNNVEDTLSVVPSTNLAVADSLDVPASVEIEQPDTTKIGFLEAQHNVRIYKKNMQVVCDSLLYSDLDSLARLFKEPIIWQEIRRQYTADSITVVIRDAAMEKASLMSNSFITIQEDSLLFDQIRATEMLAFFDDKGGLKRFDALGGASALFFIEENQALATVNKTDSKMLSAIFKDGNIERIYYYDSPKNDGYPIVQLSEDDKLLKGFNWQPDKRPANRNAVTPLSLRPSERRSYSERPKATFRQTDIYFPGYMNDVYRQMEVRDSLRAVREREEQAAEVQVTDTIKLSAPLTDTLLVKDSPIRPDRLVKTDSLVVSDSMAVTMADSVDVSVAVTEEVVAELSPEEQAAAEKARLKAERDRVKEEKARVKAEKMAAKEAEREARWAELDKRDAEKAAAKEEKRLEKERKRKIKALEDAERQADKDAAALEKYRKKYEKKKARKSSKK